MNEYYANWQWIPQFPSTAAPWPTITTTGDFTTSDVQITKLFELPGGNMEEKEETWTLGEVIDGYRGLPGNERYLVREALKLLAEKESDQTNLEKET